MLRSEPTSSIKDELLDRDDFKGLVVSVQNNQFLVEIASDVTDQQLVQLLYEVQSAIYQLTGPPLKSLTVDKIFKHNFN